jgi:RNA polymerase sigma-70 factor, ECF subfamily
MGAMSVGGESASNAVRALFVGHAVDIHRYASRRVGRDLADDVVAETFRQAIESYDAFDAERGSHRAWLFGIANNLLRRHWRTERRRLAAFERLPDPSSSAVSADPLLSVPDRLDAADDAGRVVDALDELSRSDYDLLVLVAWERMDSNEVADALGIPAGTVRSRLHRIRRQLDLARSQRPVNTNPNTNGPST